MTSSCKSSFSRAVHVALGAHLSTESATFLLQGVDSLEKARQAILGSLLFLKSGEWAYIPLDSSAVTFKNDALHALVRPSSGGHGKTVPILELGATVSGIVPGVLSSHLNETHRQFTQATYAARVRSSADGDRVVRLVISRQQDGKLELLLAADGGTGDTSNKYTDLGPAIELINRRPLSVISTVMAPPQLPEYVQDPPDLGVNRTGLGAGGRGRVAPPTLPGSAIAPLRCHTIGEL